MTIEKFTRPQPPSAARTGWFVGVLTTIGVAFPSFMLAANGFDAPTPEEAEQVTRVLLWLVVGSPLIGAVVGTFAYVGKRRSLERQTLERDGS